MKKLWIGLVALLLFALPVMAESKTIDLCLKDSGSGWQCYDEDKYGNGDTKGKITFETVDSLLQIEVEIEGLDSNAEYQLTLNGRDGKGGNIELGNNCPKPNSPATWYGYSVDYECGIWGKEGFWNFELDAMTDGNGYFKQAYHLYLPIANYESLGFIVKEAVSPWTPVIMEKDPVEFTIVGNSKKMNYIYNKLHTVQEEIAENKEEIEKLWLDDEEKWSAIGILQEKVSEIEEIIECIKGYFTDFWTWCQSPQECTEGQVKCEGNDRYNCVDYAWNEVETCGWGCSEGICNKAPRENCNDNDKVYCDGDEKVEDDYYCENGYGTDDNCIINHCLQDQTTTNCENGCTGGECNVPPTENCLTKPSDGFYCTTGGWLGRTHYSVEKDYYACNYRHGTNTECEIGYCRYRYKWNTCKNGCNKATGQCN